jgi:hypothetical protein
MQPANWPIIVTLRIGLLDIGENAIAVPPVPVNFGLSARTKVIRRGS